MHDAVVVGAGPNGLAVLKALQDAGLDAVAVDKGGVCHHLEGFPAGLVFFSTAERLTLDEAPMGDGPGTNPDLYAALAYYRQFAKRHSLRVLAPREFVGLEGSDGNFSLAFRSGPALRARKVVLATGIFSQPRLLGVPGEDGEAVSHRFPGPSGLEPGRALVVGGGNSAAEAAMDLIDRHSVTLVHRGACLDPAKVKPWVLPEVEEALAAGRLDGRFSTVVQSLAGGEARLAGPEGTSTVGYDRAFLLTGYRPDRRLLEGAGLELEGEKEAPRHDPRTLESTVPGVYVAGALLAGADAHRVFIENGRLHGAPISRHAADSLAGSGVGSPP